MTQPIVSIFDLRLGLCKWICFWEWYRCCYVACIKM